MYLNETKMAKIAIDKKLLKEYHDNVYSRIVYLENGNEFLIQLFNPESRIIGASISINNEKMPGYIVLMPGERVWVERYTNKSMKLKFSTYEVEDTCEVKNAISHNGEINIKFYRVKDNLDILYNDNIRISDKIFNPDINRVYTSSPYYSGQGSTVCTNLGALDTFLNSQLDCTANSTQINGTISSASSSPLNANINSTLHSSNLNDTFGHIFSNSTCTATNKTCSNDLAKTIEFENEQKFGCNSIETGRVTEGSYSSQNFNKVNYNFEYAPFASEIIFILPLSRKPYTKNDLKKVYCSNCGKKLNPNYKFCPACGTAVLKL